MIALSSTTTELLDCSADSHRTSASGGRPAYPPCAGSARSASRRRRLEHRCSPGRPESAGEVSTANASVSRPTRGRAGRAPERAAAAAPSRSHPPRGSSAAAASASPPGPADLRQSTSRSATRQRRQRCRAPVQRWSLARTSGAWPDRWGESRSSFCFGPVLRLGHGFAQDQGDDSGICSGAGLCQLGRLALTPRVNQ